MCMTNVRTKLYYINIKKTSQDYGAKSCLKLVLNKLKEMRGPTLIYTPLET